MPARRKYYHRLKPNVPEQSQPNWRDALPAWREVFWYVFRTLGAAAAGQIANAIVRDAGLSWQEAGQAWSEISDPPIPRQDNIFQGWESIDSGTIPDLDGPGAFDWDIS